MNLKENDSTEITLLGILKYRPSTEMTGEVFLSCIKNIKGFKFFVSAIAEHEKRWEPEKEILPPRLTLSEWKWRKEIKEKRIHYNIIWLTSFNKLPSEILLARVKAPLSFSSIYTYQDLLQKETPIFSSKSLGRNSFMFSQLHLPECCSHQSLGSSLKCPIVQIPLRITLKSAYQSPEHRDITPVLKGFKWFSHLAVGIAPAIQHCQKEPNTAQWPSQKHEPFSVSSSISGSRSCQRYTQSSKQQMGTHALNLEAAHMDLCWQLVEVPSQSWEPQNKAQHLQREHFPLFSLTILSMFILSVLTEKPCSIHPMRRFTSFKRAVRQNSPVGQLSQPWLLLQSARRSSQSSKWLRIRIQMC